MEDRSFPVGPLRPTGSSGGGNCAGQLPCEDIGLVGESEGPLDIARRDRLLGLGQEALDGEKVLLLIADQLLLIDLADQPLGPIDATLRLALDALFVLKLR